MTRIQELEERILDRTATEAEQLEFDELSAERTFAKPAQTVAEFKQASPFDERFTSGMSKYYAEVDAQAELKASAPEVRAYREAHPDAGMHDAKRAVERAKPRVIVELDGLIKQATEEHSHYYVKSVCEKAQLAIGILMAREQDLLEACEAALELLRTGDMDPGLDGPRLTRIDNLRAAIAKARGGV
jgi:hypothetical protein